LCSIAGGSAGLAGSSVEGGAGAGAGEIDARASGAPTGTVSGGVTGAGSMGGGTGGRGRDVKIGSFRAFFSSRIVPPMCSSCSMVSCKFWV
jgi:hypothetical protein